MHDSRKTMTSDTLIICSITERRGRPVREKIRKNSVLKREEKLLQGYHHAAQKAQPLPAQHSVTTMQTNWNQPLWNCSTVDYLDDIPTSALWRSSPTRSLVAPGDTVTGRFRTTPMVFPIAAQCSHNNATIPRKPVSLGESRFTAVCILKK